MGVFPGYLNFLSLGGGRDLFVLEIVSWEN